MTEKISEAIFRRSVQITTHRRFGAKPDKKIVDRSSGKPEFMEDTLHRNSDGMVVGIDRFWVVCAAGRAEWLSGGEKGFDGFVSKNEQRGHRPQTGWQRFIASGVADAAKDLFAAEFLQIVSGVAGAILRWALFAEGAYPSGDVGGGEAVG